MRGIEKPQLRFTRASDVRGSGLCGRCRIARARAAEHGGTAAGVLVLGAIVLSLIVERTELVTFTARRAGAELE